MECVCQGTHLEKVDTGFERPPRQIRESLRKYSFFNVFPFKTKAKAEETIRINREMWDELGSMAMEFAEEYLGDDMEDYKFWCFNGKAQFIVKLGASTYYDMEDPGFIRKHLRDRVSESGSKAACSFNSSSISSSPPCS